ncbi:flagellar basal-body rod protein FlgB [Pelagirhabdus alkalitolerans]|uniref:Flagellar basal body rod protein FlgB n=1 Tax=Pelagirhabdus alkalitolerans TaxID=1612202 RepID=A0A1G6H2N6_9BACI|nr:flagellar basal body rod protein FlgB [Pelagirhabdus alkalitolerans]SDB88570.1 flagellar basal-body rod protein FlgB [Pelagirhabdus alkalitolerans]
MALFGGPIANLEHGLNYATKKNETIANNISNIDTPNYKAKDVEFKSLLDSEMRNGFHANRTNERHLDFGSGSSDFRVTSNRNTRYNHNGNNVDVDKEMTELTNNQIYYQSLVDRMNGQFNDLRTVINGGR